MKKFWGLLAWTGVAVAAVSLIVWAASDSRHEHTIYGVLSDIHHENITYNANGTAATESSLGVREMYFALHRDLCCLGGLLAGGLLFAVGSIRAHSYISVRPDTLIGSSKDEIPER